MSTLIIDEFCLDDWGKLMDLEPQWNCQLYRGQSNSSWSVESSLLRALDDSDDEDDTKYAEYWSTTRFMRRAHYYLTRVPEPADFVGWLSVMQHHGTPTRLVDVTASFYVALFFALIDSHSDAAVWCFDESWLMDCGNGFATTAGIPESRVGLRDSHAARIYDAANHVLGQLRQDVTADLSETPRCVLLCEPVFEIPRISIQQGRFLMQSNHYYDFMDNLQATSSFQKYSPKGQSPVRKVTIPRAQRGDFLRHLACMNITAETLFPGIDGFARSLVQHEMIR
jgi:hypothetical protein